MAGLYIHIPFCKSRCIYCGFYSTTRLEMMEQYVESLIESLSPNPSPLREGNDYPTYAGEKFHTLYIGGGTPSQLPLPLLDKLLTRFVPLITPPPSSGEGVKGGEATVECNPDDMTPELAALLHSKGVNRVSMGAQTFNAERLRFLHRRHTAEQVETAVAQLRNAGIENISLDLMFGFPGETLAEWEEDIRRVLALKPTHISAYSLMYEEGTPLYRLLEKGEIEELDEELCRTMYYTLIDRLEQAGYEQYEISNFALPGYRSQHNSSYWHNIPYLGLGAGAHSYDGKTRQWNGSLVERGERREERDVTWKVEEVEILDDTMKYNDMITTALRTKEGINLDSRLTTHNSQLFNYMMKQAEPLIKKGLLSIDNNHLHLTRQALYVSDDVMSELIYA